MSTNNDENNNDMVHDSNEPSKPPKKSRPSMTIDEINALNYRALQKKCKSVGLSAGGSTLVLRERLSDHFEVNTDNNTDSVEDGDGNIVSVLLCIFFVYMVKYVLLWVLTYTFCRYENVLV